MRLSLVIAAHNEGDCLARTVQSCVETCAGLDYEIVIADDASWDGSIEETQNRFPRVHVVRHEERKGASPTKDLGARNARGEVLVFLDGHTKPEPGAIQRLVEDVELLKGNAVVTPAVAGLCPVRWKTLSNQVGHGYSLELERFECGWVPRGKLRASPIQGRTFYESPALIGCALAVHRELYDDLRGFDPHMRSWGVEDLDFGLKCWLLGHPILHDPNAVVAHRFRKQFDNFSVPVEHLLLNQIRMARKNFTHGVWSEWLERCRGRHSGRLSDHPEGLWAYAWELFEEHRSSVEAERSYLMSRRTRDEFWYAERFDLAWPRLSGERFEPSPLALGVMSEGSPSPEPSPSPSPEPSPPPPIECDKAGSLMHKAWWHRIIGGNEEDMNWEGTDTGPWTVVPSGGSEANSIFSDCDYSDFHLHLEFWLNDNRTAGAGALNPEDWANSGVYVFWLYEVQILDTNNGTDKNIGQLQSDTITLSGGPAVGGTRKLPTNKVCGAFYKLQPPKTNEALPHENWQTMDIYFMAARFEGEEAPVKKKNATMTVFLNGVKIQDRVGVPRGTGSRKNISEASGGGFVKLIDAEGSLKKQSGPIRLQEHGNPLMYRKIEINPNWSPDVSNWQRIAVEDHPTITPSSGIKGTVVTVDIQSDDIPRLRASGNFSPWLTWGDDNWDPNSSSEAEIRPIEYSEIVTYPNPTTVRCKFDLTGKRKGKWNVELWADGHPRAGFSSKIFEIE